MKNCQEQQKKQLKFNKKILEILSSGHITIKIVLICLIFCFIISCILIYPQEVGAGRQGTWYSRNIRKQIDAGKIIIRDPGSEDIIWSQTMEQLGQWTKKFAEDTLLEELKKSTAIAYKTALKYFLENLAFETATKLATGDWGQDPLIEHRTFKDVFKETADNAAGYFIEDLGREGFGGVKFNLCEPDFAVGLKITLGLERWHKPHKPACTFSEMKDNWEQELKDPDFLPKFQNMFNPWENDLGIALSLQTQLGAEVDKKANEAGLEKLLNQGFKPLRDPITGNIKTPASVIGEFAKDTIEKTGGENFVYTGQAVADAIGVFINTLTGKLIEEWLDKGMIDDFPEPKTWDYDDDYESQVASEGIAGAKERFRKLIEPSFAVRGDYNILGELVSCPDPTKAGPTNCVITENFRQAIINRMTVGQAMDQGYLNAEGIFGFTADGLEPDYYDEGYPYRSMIILRKFRIIPVGWELAAQYIQDFSNKTLNLGDLVACYDPSDDYPGDSPGWCQGLVDPNWVLKAPLNYCKREGPGPEIISEQVIGSGYDSELSISRNDNYCADEQSCIQENDDGSCQLYGYCTEERRKWQFNGTNCEPRYNTCQTFRSRTGDTASYLENTLDYRYCTADNVGCQPYCTELGDVEYDVASIMPAGAVAYWKFDEGSGNTAFDYVGGRNGTLFGPPSWVDGKIGGALEFNGAGYYIEAGTISLTDQDFTVSAWVNKNVSGGVLVGTLTGGAGDGFSLMSNSSRPGGISLFWVQNWVSHAEHYYQTVYSDIIITDNQWHYIVGVRKGATSYIYIDGNLEGSDSSSVVSLPDNDPIVIGRMRPGQHEMNGIIDEVSIYNRALSAGEISDYYNNSIMTRFGYACTQTTGDKLYADKDIEECDSDDEGCHEFIRTKAGIGANLLHSSNFENDENLDGVADGWGGYHTDVTWELVEDAVSGTYSQRIVSGTAYGAGTYGGIARGDVSDILSTVGEAYTVSFYAKKGAMGPDNNNSITFHNQSGSGDGSCLSFSVDLTSQWQRYSKTCILDVSKPQIYFWSYSPSEEFFIDAVKIEHGITATAYSDYRENGLIYQKLAPDYLGCTGTASDPDECDNFTRKCNQSEVGCELFTSVSDDMSIPAKVTAQDYCAAECVGYDTYIQQETVFDSLRDAYFIPSTARVCGAESAGCDEFTNLDEVARGGEGIEYYSYLRQCVKPSDPGVNCAEFYTWEGSDETGFQLRLHSLEEDFIGADGILNDPDVTSDDTTECDAAIYGLPATDPGYNSDCREFYNDSGAISYHLFKRTISCDENCHPFRRTENNIDPNLDNGSCFANGDGSSKYIGTVNDQFEWDGVNNVCYFCKNRGEWSDDHQACLYMAVPDQGIRCSAGQNGCREYSGNVGNNMRIVLNNDFEDDIQGWSVMNGSGTYSSESIMVGGHSFRVIGDNPIAWTNVGNLAQKDKSYVLSFLAQSAGASQISAIKLVNGAGEETEFPAGNSVSLSGSWQLYKVNLAALNHDVSDSESLAIEANGDFYIDDIRLTEITDRWYLIKNSWVTPDSCYEDILGNYVGPIYNLGCDEYYDHDNDTHYLHSFSQLCQESAVGCEIMIDTHNYTDYKAEGWNDGGDNDCAGDGDDCVVVEADSFVYVVYDKNKKCNSRDKGCQRLGNPSYQYASDVLYSDIYLKNDPDKYNEILCLTNEAGCEEWATTEGTDYFKDPGDQLCEWRQAVGLVAGSWGWYKKKVKRCDTDNDSIGNGNICLADNDCDQTASPAETCELEASDNACTTYAYKTLGKGGAGNIIEQPTWDADGYWIGLCPASQAGCAEYIDPVSRFSANMLFNPDFLQDVDSDGLADGWSASVGGEQNITLEPRTLYVLAVENNNTATVGATNNVFYELNSNNNLAGPYNSISVTSSAGSRTSKRFYTTTNVSAKITVNDASKSNNSKIELKQAVIDYQLKQDVDKTTCNGIVDFDQGCVLFNQRNQNGISLAGLDWDADLTVDDGTGVTPDAGLSAEQDANILLKVTPDRVCDKWLACRSFIKDQNDNNVCFDIGLCDSVDDNGNCDSFVITNQVNQTYPNLISAELAGNMSGYVKAGYNNSSLKADYYPLGAMEQIGEVANAPNGGFEWAGSNGYPIGWTWAGGTWDENVFKVINNPIEAQTEGIGYAPEGRNFLKLGSTYSATSEFIDVEPSIDYILTAHINTINLSEGTATIKVEQFNNAGNLVATNNSVVTENSKEDWTFKLGSFTTAANASRIKITLHAIGDITGNFYFDDVKLRPALNSKANWNTPQTCRLYPQDDSLSCDYYEDSGKRQRGWLGYCLEYDRYPGSDDACLLWWPVDKVKGEGIEEGAGYNGKIPAHYCAEAKGLHVLEYRQPRVSHCMYEEWFDHWCNPTNAGVQSGYALCGYDNCCYTTPSGTCITGCSGSVSTCSNVGWYEYNGSFVEQEASYGIKFYDPNTGEVFDDIFAYCTKVVQTVNSVGGNKYWAGRVYEGSDYAVPGLGYEYSSDYPPFGAIVEPFPTNNPYEWDGSDRDGIQPLYVIREGVRASHPYKIDNISIGSLGICRDSKDVCLHINGVDYEKNKADCPAGDVCNLVNFSGNSIEKIKRLFAQSYGYWEWDGSHYMPVSGQDWTVPTNLCNGTGLEPRPGYPNDWCGIKPIISNIKANSQGGNIVLNNNQFINLTFNSKVNSQQLPLVMYAINWGDNEWTVVTGVEMRDRPNIDNPHSLYHLYSYWDLKAKHSVDQDDLATAENDNTIYCGDASNSALNYNNSDSGYDCPASGACCVVKPSAKVKDNWGWCNNGAGGNPCPAGGYDLFGGWIVVKEK